MLGRKVLHWFDNSVVSIKNFESYDSFLVLDMGELDLTESYDIEKLDKVKDIIIDWNVNKEYNQTENNCQNFCNEILEALCILLFNLK
jgi:hypothetical protein